MTQPRSGSGSASSPDPQPPRKLAPPATPPARLVPRVPDHELLHPIGRGAYGEVWLARSVLGTFRAVKWICRGDFSDSPPFEREFMGLQKFEPVSRAHPALVDVLQVGRPDGEDYYYYVMELADAVGSSKIAGRSSNERAKCEVRSAEAGQRPKSEDSPAAARFRPSPCGVPSDFGLRTLDCYAPRTLRHDLRTRGRLPFAECLDLGLALAGALEHLHEHGLIHRDVKPSNVIFVNGQPKLADIGLVAGIDEARSFVGTEGFVPPEGPGTPQADLYSAGKLLYEAAMGRSRIEFPALPADWDTIPPEEQARLLEFNEVLLKACESDPRQRYRDAGELRRDLERLAQGGSVRRRHTRERLVRRAQQAVAVGIVALLAGWGAFSLVRGRATTGTATAAPGERASVFVLPFRSEGTNAVPDDLRDRMTDAFIDSLAMIQGVRRSPRKSGWVYRDEVELREALARTNDFRHVLCGQVREAGGELVLELRLLDRRRNTAVWEESFAAPTNAVAVLERRGLDSLTGRLGLTVVLDEWAAIDGILTDNLEALGWFRKAVAVYARRGTIQKASVEASGYCDLALGLDPAYVAAESFRLEMKRNIALERSTTEAWPGVGQDADTVLRHDDTVAVAWDHKAGWALVRQGDWTAFHSCYARLVEVVPDLRRSFYRAWYLRICGHLEAAQCEQDWFESADSPLTDDRLLMATSRWVHRRFREGVAIARQTLATTPDNYDTHWILARCLLAEGEYLEAIRVIERGLQLWKGRELTALLACAYAGLGDRARARKELEGILGLQDTVPYVQPYFVARVYAALGEKEAALNWLQKSADDRSEFLFLPDLGGLRTDPAWDALQDEARYWQICEQVGLGRADWPRKEFLP